MTYRSPATRPPVVHYATLIGGFPSGCDRKAAKVASCLSQAVTCPRCVDYLDRFQRQFAPLQEHRP